MARGSRERGKGEMEAARWGGFDFEGDEWGPEQKSYGQYIYGFVEAV